MSRRFAENTRVPVSRSEGEIKDTLRRFGAIEIATGESVTQAMVGFVTKRAKVRILIPMPTDKTHPNEHKREAEKRRRYRALLLVLKAKLEAVESGISTFEAEFLAHVVLPGGMTIGDACLPRLEKIASEGLPPLLTA